PGWAPPTASRTTSYSATRPARPGPGGGTTARLSRWAARSGLPRSTSARLAPSASTGTPISAAGTPARRWRTGTRESARSPLPSHDELVRLIGRADGRERSARPTAFNRELIPIGASQVGQHDRPGRGRPRDSAAFTPPILAALDR